MRHKIPTGEDKFFSRAADDRRVRRPLAAPPARETALVVGEAKQKEFAGLAGRTVTPWTIRIVAGRKFGHGIETLCGSRLHGSCIIYDNSDRKFPGEAVLRIRNTRIQSVTPNRCWLSAARQAGDYFAAHGAGS